jgi:hypothetical protein
MLLSDTRYKNFNYIKIIKNLKKQSTKKFDPNELYLAMNFYKKNIKKNNIYKSKHQLKKNIIIFGNGESLNNEEVFHNKLISNATIVVVNRSNHLKKRLIDMMVYCHPLRIISDIDLLKRTQCKLLMPYFRLPEILQKKIKNLYESISR